MSRVPEAQAEPAGRSPRVNFPARVEFAGEFFTVREFSANLSESGVFLPTERVLPPGTRGTLTFQVSQWDRPFAVQAEVVRAVTQEDCPPGRLPGIGVRFVELSEVDHDRLRRLVRGVRDGSVVQAIRRSLREDGTGLDHELRRRPIDQKLILATFASAEEIDALIRDGQRAVIERLLANPRIRVPQVRAILRNTSLPYAPLAEIGRQREWLADEEARYLFCRHPSAPLQEALLLLAQLPVPRIRQLAADTNLRPAILDRARALLKDKSRSGF